MTSAQLVTLFLNIWIGFWEAILSSPGELLLPGVSGHQFLDLDWF
jgi:hypothetical protein